MDKYLISADVKTGNNKIHEYVQLDCVVRRISAGDGRTFFKLASIKNKIRLNYFKILISYDKLNVMISVSVIKTS